MECQSTVTSSRTIEELLVEASDRTFRQHAPNLVLRVFVVSDLLVLALNVIRLNPFGTRVNVGRIRAERHLRCLRLLGLLTAEIQLARGNIGGSRDTLFRCRQGSGLTARR